MKTLVVVRHAKSSWADITLDDFDRPLNDRGKKDAPEMARRLLAKKIAIKSFVSSPAKRARKTCEAFCEVYDVKEGKIVFVDELYHASHLTFYDVVESKIPEKDCVAIFSHNNGITDFVNTLVPGVHIDDMPTCGVFVVKANIESWKDFRNATREFVLFDAPKL